ncbi:MAG: sigma-70 family RNA polymerase sigma factor [Paludibacteraceae bacterium]|nr:sigma-70 family RNA polymerase sigma factor [Paludibacteraceae bacterium]
MNGNLSDIELIRQVLRENNPRAFEMLMQRYSVQVYSAALRLMHDEEDAAEVTQMAFIQAYKQLDSWQGGNFGAWVTVIANHIGLRLLEKEKRRRFRTGASQPYGTEISIEDLSEDLPDEGYNEQKEEQLQALEQAVAQLPEQEQQIIRWHYYEGVPLQKIADRLGQTENNIKVRLFRIRERLKKKIEHGKDN